MHDLKLFSPEKTLFQEDILSAKVRSHLTTLLISAAPDTTLFLPIIR